MHYANAFLCHADERTYSHYDWEVMAWWLESQTRNQKVASSRKKEKKAANSQN